ncbi:MAG TPA: hypothetical protein VNZ52_08010 [Candidatus Thermoplasmatota archaeon]|nr:hypothetical protein [Candidatus Thermoplasmatota archaeon]
MKERVEVLLRAPSLGMELRAAREALDRVANTLRSASAGTAKASLADLSAERRIFELTVEVIEELEAELSRTLTVSVQDGDSAPR